jgi:hypothetical protein
MVSKIIDKATEGAAARMKSEDANSCSFCFNCHIFIPPSPFFSTSRTSRFLVLPLLTLYIFFTPIYFFIFNSHTKCHDCCLAKLEANIPATSAASECVEGIKAGVSEQAAAKEVVQ